MGTSKSRHWATGQSALNAMLVDCAAQVNVLARMMTHGVPTSIGATGETASCWCAMSWKMMEFHEFVSMCAALGYGQVHIIGSGGKHKQSSRTSQQAEKWLDVHLWSDTASFIEQARLQGRQIVATHFAPGCIPISVRAAKLFSRLQMAPLTSLWTAGVIFLPACSAMHYSCLSHTASIPRARQLCKTRCQGL